MILYEDEYRRWLESQGVGSWDQVASSPDSYVSYLRSVSELVGKDISPGLLSSEDDLEKIAEEIARDRAPKTLLNYKSAMRQYVAMVASLRPDRRGRAPSAEATQMDFRKWAREQRSKFKPQGADVPDVLCHYTSALGLKGILDSGKLRATNIFGLPAELAHGIELSRQVMRNIVETEPSFKDDVHRLESSLDKLNEVIAEGYTSDLYITCFCDSSECLGMWRYYGANGYCIGFNALKLLEQVERNRVRHPLAGC
jgi:hypothetical protein